MHALAESPTSHFHPVVRACAQLFCDAKRGEVKAANPSAGFKEMSSLLAGAWKSAGEAERTPFVSLHQVRT